MGFFELKCPICGVEIVRPPITAHYEASHSDFAEWISHERRLGYYVVFSYGVLILVDVLYERFLTPYFLFALIAYVFTTVVLLTARSRRKIRELRAVWKETHSNETRNDQAS